MHPVLPSTLEEAQAVIARQQQELAQLQGAHEAWMRAVAHDLRAPLRHVLSFAPLLREAVEELAAAAPQAADAVADAREFTTTMEQSARKMSAMLDGMAQVSHAARAPLALGLIDWGVVARHVAQRWQATHPMVQWSLPEAPVPVMADAAALQALTEAVLHNAVKFSARQAQPVVRLSAHPLDDGWWRLQVQDQGVGFDRQRAQHLGELFQRMHRDAEFPGVGCGLALVQTVAQRHGARVAIEAQPQAGCTVCIDWPGAL